MVYEEILPHYLAIGVSWERFMESCPYELWAYEKAHEQRLSEQNSLMHLQGHYFVEALRSTVGNMFKKKTAKPYEYPKKPLELGEKTDYTEDELQKQRELFVMKFEAMRINYNLEKNGSSK